MAIDVIMILIGGYASCGLCLYLEVAFRTLIRMKQKSHPVRSEIDDLVTTSRELLRVSPRKAKSCAVIALVAIRECAMLALVLIAMATRYAVIWPWIITKKA